MPSSSLVSSPELAPEEQLTPRSKVAKMLADIDNAPSSPASPLQLEPRIFKSHAASDNASTTSVQPSNIRDDSGESEDDVPVPKGKAARRMLGVSSAIQESSRKVQPQQVRRCSSASSSEGESSEGNDSDVARPARRERSRKPQLNTAGSLFVSPDKAINSDNDDLPSPTRALFARSKLHTKRRLNQRLIPAKLPSPSPPLLHRSETSSELPQSVSDMESDKEVNRNLEQILSDAVRPIRKASKKAIEEMTRETQRMAREQALAHDMKVKKKFTTQDLFARFNYGGAQSHFQVQPNRADGSSSTHASDGTEPEASERHDTPPSSPPEVDASKLSSSLPGRAASSGKLTVDPVIEGLDDDLPDDPLAVNVVSSIQQGTKLSTLPSTDLVLDNSIHLADHDTTMDLQSSDSELEVLQPLPAHLKVFDLVQANAKTKPANACKAIHTLRHLSHIGAYDAVARKKGVKSGIGHDTLELRLRRRAKAQARQEELARIAELKALGIVVQTAEERENEAEVYENLLEKARMEALQLRRAEKADQTNQNIDEIAMQASDDESEDADYSASGSEEDDISGHDAHGESGDDEDGSMDDDDEEVDPTPDQQEPFAHESGRGDEQSAVTVDSVTDFLANGKHRLRKVRIIQDEDDDSDPEPMDSSVSNNQALMMGTPIGKSSASMAPTPTMQVDPFAIFDVNRAGGPSLLMSPTQAFNATMQTPTQMTQSGLRNVFGGRQTQDRQLIQQDLFEEDVSIIPSSQIQHDPQGNNPRQPSPCETPRSRLMPPMMGAPETPGWEPTQDEGPASPWSVNQPEALARPSTIDFETQSTVRLRVSESPAPLATKQRGRLVARRELGRVTADPEDEPSADMAVQKAHSDQPDAFDYMKRRRLAEVSEAERRAAMEEMKGMMDDQAEESDDEYAGVGGDDYIAPESEQDRQMIDSSHIDVDEQALAAHHAEKQRLADEAETSKLYKDLTTGALRRKQANMFDLEDDEDEMAIRRRQLRQQDEAKKRRLLLQDDNIAGLAEGKQSVKKDAFLKAIADDDERDDLSDLSDDDVAERDSSAAVSQELPTASPESAVLKEISVNKRPAMDGFEKPEDRPPAKMRRTQASGAFRRPTSILEVKQSVSFLLEEPDSAWYAAASVVNERQPADEDYDRENEVDVGEEEYEDGDDDDAAIQEALRDNDGGFAAPPKPVLIPSRAPASQRRTASIVSQVVDRLTLKRDSSSASETNERSAWAMPSAATFKAPSLLRRATTNLGMTVNERGVSTPSLSREGSTMRSGGSKRSSLAYQARAEERMAIVQASARRRQENTAKMAQLRRHCTADARLSRSLGGRFE